MATDLLGGEPSDPPTVELASSQEDIELLLRRVQELDDRLVGKIVASTLLAAVLGTLLVATIVYTAVFLPEVNGVSLVAMITASLITFSAGFLMGKRSTHRTEREISGLLELLRQAAPALVQQGKLSELRWATIKIQLSRYGI